MAETTGRLDRGKGTELAWVRVDGRGPTVVFLPGFRSDMTGDKATALAAFCAERGLRMLRFDYSGHGASSGDFLEGTIGAWLADALAAIDALTSGPLVPGRLFHGRLDSAALRDVTSRTNGCACRRRRRA